MADVTTPQPPKLTPTEETARSALTAADEALRTAQEFVTKALAPLATLEQERHPNGPRYALAISEARASVFDAQRKVTTLLQFAIPSPGFVPAGINASADDLKAQLGVDLRTAEALVHQRSEGARFA